MRFTILIIATFFTLQASAQFDSLFFNKSLRIDYFHSGNFDSEFYSLDEVKIEPFWGGSKVNLVDTFYYGAYFFKVFDAQTEDLIYSRGYSTLFGEWQTTSEAKITKRSLSETVVCPLPKNDARIDFFSRDKKGEFQKVFEYEYKTNNYFISPERKLVYPSFDALVNGPTEKSVDIVVLPEGYTNDEMGKFISDCQEFAEVLFSFEPYKKYRDKFNIRGVLAPSEDTGNDIPADSMWANTILNTSFYTFDSERYCMTYDNKSVRNLSANAPYDQIYILVNSEKYGGGAIYNYYSVSVNSNAYAAKIFIHELGHGFAGLGDEYYTSSVAYSEFYPLDVEPWEPNLTTLVNFDKKWKTQLHKKTPIPTPSTDKFIGETGVFEGGGYAAKGVYRPAYDCLMNSFAGDHFCEVCELAIEKMIQFYTE
jgi:hypothetical protein